MSRLKFIIDKQYDAKMIFYMLKNKDYAVIKYQSEVMGIDFKTSLEISKIRNFNLAKKIIFEIVDKQYYRLRNKLKDVKINYQKSWDQIDKQFFKRLEEITNFSVQYDHYYCVVSVFHIGISSWGGNKIVRKYDEDYLKQRKITAHEIIISHFFSLMNEKYPNIKDDQKIWQLAEIFAFAVTAKDKIFTKLWPWEKNDIDFDHNYKELISTQKKLAPILLSHGLNEFIKVGLK